MLRHKQRKKDIRFGTWNVRSLYRAGPLTATATELVRYELYLVGVQGARWDRGDTLRAGAYNFFKERMGGTKGRVNQGLGASELRGPESK